MKKYILSFAMMVMGASLLTSCLNDNDNNNQPVKIPITTGLYVVNNGQWNKNNGSLTYFDYTTLKAQQLFSGVGELGDTPNDAYTKGDTIFIVVSTDNMIVAYNKKTNSSRHATLLVMVTTSSSRLMEAMWPVWMPRH